VAKGKNKKTTEKPDKPAEAPPPAEAASEGAPRRSAGGSWDGAALRSARERNGLSVEELSARTKINIAILRALEEERFEDAPKARVYVRGFVRCMAEEIGADPDEVVKSYVPRWEIWAARQGPELGL
jgi:cytoskeleton protein RodZ